MQSEEGQDKQDADPIAPKVTAETMFVAHAWEQAAHRQQHFRERNDLETWLATLLPVCSVHDPSECSGIPDEKERQVLQVFREKCCGSKEISDL